MANIKYDENPDSILNKKILQMWGIKDFEEFKKACRELYELGCDDGQAFVWKVRQGNFDSFEINENLPEEVKKEIREQLEKEKKAREEVQTATITTNADGKSIYFAEMVSGKLVMKHGIPDDKWGTR
jgi:uncharacterized protein YaaW (UPF0174 family)